MNDLHDMNALPRIAHPLPLPFRLLAAAALLCAAAFAGATTPPARAPAAPPAAPPTVTPAPEPELVARVTTPRGTFRFKLHAKETPLTVANFCNLAKRGFFDGLPIFSHTRVLRSSGRPFPEFNAGYTFRREFNRHLRFDQGGQVAMMPRGEGPDATTMATDWFVTIKNQERWTLERPVFGTVIEGLDVVQLIQPTDSIIKVEIEGDPAPLLARYADQIRDWNAALDRALARRPSAPPAATPPATSPGAPPASPPAAAPAGPPAAPPPGR